MACSNPAIATLAWILGAWWHFLGTISLALFLAEAIFIARRRDR